MSLYAPLALHPAQQKHNHLPSLANSITDIHRLGKHTQLCINCHLNILSLRTQRRKQHPILNSLDISISFLHIFGFEPISQDQLAALF